MLLSLFSRPQLLRVTRDLSEMIKQGGHEARQAAEIERLEKKIEYTRQMTDTKIADRTYRLNKVQCVQRSDACTFFVGGASTRLGSKRSL